MRRDGYAVLSSVLSPVDVQQWRAAAIPAVCGPTSEAAPGFELVGIAERPQFEAKVQRVLSSPQLQRALAGLVGGSGWQFCGHSDIGCNRIVFWHKDKLNGQYAKFQKLSPWNVSGHKIFKILIYLQDHQQDGNALKILRASHLEDSIPANFGERTFDQLRPSVGDVVLMVNDSYRHMKVVLFPAIF